MTPEEKLKVLCQCMGVRLVDCSKYPSSDATMLSIISDTPLLGLTDKYNIGSNGFYHYNSIEDALNALLAWTPNKQPN